MPDDGKTGAASSTATDEQIEVKDESLEASEAGADQNPEGEESDQPLSKKAQQRFQQLLQQRKQAEEIANWYRANIGDPNDVIEFQKHKAQMVAAAKAAEQEGEISPAKLKEIKALMRKADPEYAQYIEQQKQDQTDRIEAQFDAAEEQIRELATAAGIPAKNEAAVARLARQVMLEIDQDPKLKRLWASGNLSCIKKAYAVLEKDFLGVIRKATPAQSKDIADRRRISRLPTLPSAQGTLSQQSKDKDDKGITKSAHKQAWAILQAGRQD
jgi:hypothetical protein